MRIDGIVIIVDRDINDIDDNSDNSDNNDISDIGVINDGNDNDVIIVGIIWIGWSGYRFLILSVLNLVSMGVEISYSKSYFRLDAWVLANVVQLATQSFCRRFVSFHDDPRRRLFDQMVMAARSAVANIAEGSARHNTSVETEMRLTDVARASVDELFGDYFNFLMSRNLSVWDKDSEHTGSVWWMVIDRPQYGADQLADVARHILVQKSKFDYYIEGDDAGMAANCLLLLCERLNRMLQRMMESQLKYFKQNGDNAYIIVGSSKNGVGTTTLHKYQGGNWSNTGDLFFTGTSVGQDGKFWEMPNITEMSDGNWLFTATPLETSTGVHTLYWTGSIDGEGHFVPSSNSATPKNVELISKDGFGLLSPTIYKHDEKVIALGIVPDKLPSSTNWKLGWAHCYSLPREWSLNSEGVLVQKPYEGLKDMRSDANVSFKDCKISDVMPLDGVSGRRVEMLGQFQVGASAFGFKFFKGATGEATIKYVPSSNELVIDFTQLRRLVNDNGVYDGIYRAVLPERLAEGSEMKMNVFIDGSIVDVFINDRWATSVRVFPTEADADGVEVFSEGGEVHASSIDAWVLKSGSIHGGVSLPDADSYNPSKIVDVYSISGQLIRKGVLHSNAIDGLENGIYLVDNRKVLVR